MSESSGATTMSDLMVRVAEKLSIAEYTSTGQIHIPVDQYNFNLCKRYIQNGIRMFMADAPRKGWRWMRRICSVTFAVRVTGTVDSIPVANQLLDATLMATYTAATDLVDWYCYILTGTGEDSNAQITAYDETTGTITVADWLTAAGAAGGTDPVAGDTFVITSVATTAGDTSRYNLPANFSGTVDGKIKYAANTNKSDIIGWCDESTIRARRSISVNSGTPILAAIRPYQPTDENLSSTRLWEMIIDPQSIAALVVEFPYTLHFDEMLMESGTATNVVGGNLSDSTLANLYPDDLYNGWRITIIAGTGRKATALITNYDGSDGEFFVDDWLYSDDTAAAADPATGSKYIIEPVANLHPAGHQFDDAIEAACLARTEMESQDEHFDTFWSDYYHKKALPNAYRVDMRSAPRKLGPMLGGPNILIDRHRRYYGRTFNDVTYD